VFQVTDSDVFKHSTPELYDLYMAPLLFAPYAQVVTERVQQRHPRRILETAAGTGVLTRVMADAMPDVEIVATDINPGVVEFAARKLDAGNVTCRQANAQELPFDDASFDLVVCQFGVMFFPDKVAANVEAHRVLRSGGTHVSVTFDRLELNPIPKAADDAVDALFADDPIRYMDRGPFSYTDPDRMEADLRAAGFPQVVVETVPLSTHVDRRRAAQGMVLGSPFRAEIERRDPAGLERALDAVTKGLAAWDGKVAPMSAHLATATK
jgi:ubiquinone/menaquinone biosynthesis C-methylase UbiE